MKQLLSITLSLVAVAVLANTASAQAVAKYDEATGAILLELPTGIGVAGFEFPAGYDQSAAAVSQPENPAQKSGTILAYFNANGLAAGSYNLGNLLPSGIAAADLNSRVLFSASPIGQNPVPADVVHVPADIVPEPAALLLAGLASVLGLGVRRRQS
jgi:hypothetical protein